MRTGFLLFVEVVKASHVAAPRTPPIATGELHQTAKKEARLSNEDRVSSFCGGLRVNAVGSRDGCHWNIGSGISAEEEATACQFRVQWQW